MSRLSLTQIRASDVSVVRFALRTLFLLVFALLERSLFGYLAIGLPVIPLTLILGLVMCIHEGERGRPALGALCFAGLFLDLTSPAVFGFYAFSFTVSAVLARFLVARVFDKGALTTLVVLSLALLVAWATQYGLLFVVSAVAGVSVLYPHVDARLFTSWVIALAIGFATHLITVPRSTYGETY